MSEKQKTIVALTVLNQTCTAAQDQIGKNRVPHTSNLEIVHKDFISLLSLLYASTTKVALALKPSSPTYSASLSPLRDLSEKTASLAHCVNFFQPDLHGQTLVHEIDGLARDVIDSILALAQTLLHILATNSSSSTGKAGDEYMVRTAAVHQLIDKARDGSTNNVEAARKKWTEDHESLRDAFREVTEMVEDAEKDDSENADDEADGDSDGWDDFGLGSSTKLTKLEVERTKKMHALLRLTTLLHKRIPSDILTSTGSINSSSVVVDTLLSHGKTLLAASDELVATLYGPQNVHTMLKELSSFTDVIHTLEFTLVKLYPPVPNLETQLESLELTPENTKKKDVRKWFTTCFEQLYKNANDFAAFLKVVKEDGEL